MSSVYSVWQNFWQNQNELKKAISQNAKRASLSEEAALLLMAIFEFEGLKIAADEYIFNELLQKGLLCENTSGFKPTAKGAILAKSFCEAFKKY